jgi:hypothetical protein
VWQAVIYLALDGDFMVIKAEPEYFIFQHLSTRASSGTSADGFSATHLFQIGFLMQNVAGVWKPMFFQTFYHDGGSSASGGKLP